MNASTEGDQEPGQDEERRPEDQSGEPGAEGGSHGSSSDKLPASPSSDDDSPLGSTDQHSSA
jgi:hypothetical protein